jgi:hypothetical protein
MCELNDLLYGMSKLSHGNINRSNCKAVLFWFVYPQMQREITPLSVYPEHAVGHENPKFFKAKQ